MRLPSQRATKDHADPSCGARGRFRCRHSDPASRRHRSLPTTGLPHPHTNRAGGHVNLKAEGEPDELEVSVPNRGVESKVRLSWAGHENLYARVSLHLGLVVEPTQTKSRGATRRSISPNGDADHGGLRDERSRPRAPAPSHSAPTRRVAAERLTDRERLDEREAVDLGQRRPLQPPGVVGVDQAQPLGVPDSVRAGLRLARDARVAVRRLKLSGSGNPRRWGGTAVLLPSTAAVSRRP